MPNFRSSISRAASAGRLRFNDGRLPFWIFDPGRRVPGTRVLDYLALARLLWPAPGKTVGEVIACEGVLYERLVEPLLLAALNIDPPQGSAKLAAAVIRETLAAGGRACRPLIAREGLGATLIEPALALSCSSAASTCASSISCARSRFGDGARRGARFRRRDRRARRRRRGHSRGAALYRGVAGARPRRADRIPRHRQCAFPHRAAGRTAADPRRAQRHDRMAVRLSGPAVGHDQRRRPADSIPRARNWRRRSGARSRA